MNIVYSRETMINAMKIHRELYDTLRTYADVINLCQKSKHDKNSDLDRLKNAELILNLITKYRKTVPEEVRQAMKIEPEMSTIEELLNEVKESKGTLQLNSTDMLCFF